MRDYLERLFNNERLTRTEAHQLLGAISDNSYTPESVSALLTVYRMRSITVEELTGFRDCLLERMHAIDLSDFDTVDLCGTGGDGKDTFNISTLAAFVVAGTGRHVAKHGNYSVSSSCGSSDVLKYLGYQFTADVDLLKTQLDSAHICFLHAPLFHPAMKAVGPIRRNLGIRTFFNVLGPMVNPAQPKRQLVGVFSMELQRYYSYIYEQEQRIYRIVHSLDGYDEISLTSKAKIVTPSRTYLLDPSELVEEKIRQESLYGGKDVADSAKIFMEVLEGNGSSAQSDAVCANAALAIQSFEPARSLSACFEEARASLRGGAALESFKQLITTCTY